MFSDSDSDGEQPTNTYKDQVKYVFLINILVNYRINLNNIY